MTRRESAAVAQELIAACCKQQRVARGQLTIHADRGSPMVARSTAQLYIDLGIAKIHSRPHTSNDNPYSESNFRTLKYRPDMPVQLGSIEHARQVIRAFVDWYNEDHYHVSLALLHPVDVHYGRTTDIVAARQRVLDEALARHPERFVRGRPVQKKTPPEAWINPPPMDQLAITPVDRIEEVAARQFVAQPVSKSLTGTVPLASRTPRGELLVRTEVANLGFDLVELLVRGERESGALIAGVERFHENTVLRAQRPRDCHHGEDHLHVGVRSPERTRERGSARACRA